MIWKNVTYGKNRVRRNYSRVRTNVELPNLIEVQLKSFEWFMTTGLKELFGVSRFAIRKIGALFR